MPNFAHLRKHGAVWAEFHLEEGTFGKTVTLWMRKADGQRAVPLLELTVVGDSLLYSTVGNRPVLGPTTKGVEHATDEKT